MRVKGNSLFETLAIGLVFIFLSLLLYGCYDYKSEETTTPTTPSTSPPPTTPPPTSPPPSDKSEKKWYVSINWTIDGPPWKYTNDWTLLGGEWYLNGSLTSTYSGPAPFFQYYDTFILKEGKYTTSFKLTNQTSSPNTYTISLSIFVEDPYTGYSKAYYPYEDEKRSLKTGEVISYTFNVP